MRGDAHDARARLIRGLQIVNYADAGQPQSYDMRVLHHVRDRDRDRFDPFEIAMRAEAAVIEARTLQTVAMRDFDAVHFRLIERARNLLHVVDRIQMTERLTTVAQCHVRDVKFPVHEMHLLKPARGIAPCARQSRARPST